MNFNPNVTAAREALSAATSLPALYAILGTVRDELAHIPATDMLGTENPARRPVETVYSDMLDKVTQMEEAWFAQTDCLPWHSDIYAEMVNIAAEWAMNPYYLSVSTYGGAEYITDDGDLSDITPNAAINPMWAE
jgi:hypothetical protein